MPPAGQVTVGFPAHAHSKSEVSTSPNSPSEVPIDSGSTITSPATLVVAVVDGTNVNATCSPAWVHVYSTSPAATARSCSTVPASVYVYVRRAGDLIPAQHGDRVALVDVDVHPHRLHLAGEVGAGGAAQGECANPEPDGFNSHAQTSKRESQ